MLAIVMTHDHVRYSAQPPSGWLHVILFTTLGYANTEARALSIQQSAQHCNTVGCVAVTPSTLNHWSKH